MAKSRPTGRTTTRPTLRGQQPVRLQGRSRSRLPLLLGIGALLLLIVVAAWWFSRANTSTTSSSTAQATERAIEPFATDPAVGRDHVDGKPVQYNANPPAGGEHWSRTATWGIQTTPPPDESLVHNLEHGGVIIWYDPAKVDAGTVNRLKSLTRNLQETNFRVVLTPRTKGIENNQPIAMTSWGHLMTLDGYDEGKIRNFFRAHINNGPECQDVNGTKQCPG